MVTNYPQQLVSAAEITYEKTTGFVSRTAGRLGQLLCGLRGHDSVLHFESSRVMMRCTSCGHDTPGWHVGERPPRKRFDGDARRHALKPQLVLRKSA